MKNFNFNKLHSVYFKTASVLFILMALNNLIANEVANECYFKIENNVVTNSYNINTTNGKYEIVELSNYYFFNSNDDTLVNQIDTVSIEMDGLDSVIIYTIDSTTLGEDSIALRTASTIDDIKIKLCGESREINPGLFGVTIEGFFRPKQTPIDDEDNLEAWDWLSDLQPKLIRFPGGASGTFMHLLPFQDLEAPFEVLDSIKGYGYDINEIIRYFDGTDLSIETDEPGFVESIHTDMLDEICDDFDL